jgi:Phenazine biosynthesis-like protein
VPHVYPIPYTVHILIILKQRKYYLYTSFCFWTFLKLLHVLYWIGAGAASTFCPEPEPEPESDIDHEIDAAPTIPILIIFVLHASGNPAAVCLLDDDISDSLKQQIAAEMNISETAFLTKLEGDSCGDFTTGHTFSLRWFTPTTEVNTDGFVN